MSIQKQYNVDAIRNGERLFDEDIDFFALLLHHQFGYVFLENWRTQLLDLLEPLDLNKRHIQILHNRAGDSDFNYHASDHWVCMYYDTNKIYIFDSINNKQLTEKQTQCVNRLYPSIPLNPGTNIIFPDVQNQSNDTDCGVFAIAFAVSLAHGEWPENLQYDQQRMRQHLLNIFESQILSVFPKSLTSQCSKKQNNTPNVNKKSKNNFKVNHTCGNERYNDKVCNKSEKLKRKLPDDCSKEHDQAIKRKRKALKNTIPIFSENLKNIILNGQRLTDDHMLQFKFILANCTNYNHRDTLFLARPCNIKPVEIWEKHIQILYSRNEHWVCSYYNSKNIYIYDSLSSNNKKNLLHEDHKIFLKHLYPFYNVDVNNIYFPKVQQQTNIDDCGVFAIAFAVSLVYNLKPEFICYNVDLMRSHLLGIFESNIITHFPTVSNVNRCKSMDLKKINRNNNRSLCIRREKYPTNTQRTHLDKNVSPAKLLANNSKSEKNVCSKITSPSSTNVQDVEEIELVHQNSNKSNITKTIPKLNKIKNKLPKFNAKNHKKQSKTTNQKLAVTRKIIHKYRVQDKCRTNLKLKFTSEQYIKKISAIIDYNNCVTYAEKRLEAQRIVNWILFQRKTHIKALYNSLCTLKKKADKKLCRLSVFINEISAQKNKLSNSEKLMLKYKYLCGKSLHCPSTEAYFYDTSYVNIISKVFIMNKIGQVMNVLPLIDDKKSKRIRWTCDEYCRYKHDNDTDNNKHSIFVNYKKFLENLSTRNIQNFPVLMKKVFYYHLLEKKGHFSSCYEFIDGYCGLFYPSIFSLSAHFPEVRYVKRLIYRIAELYNEINKLDTALNNVDLHSLIKLTNEITAKKYTLNKNNEISFDEDNILVEHKKAFLAFTNRSLNIPNYKCLSCQRLTFRSKVSVIHKLKKPIDTDVWKHFNLYIEDKDYLKSDFICSYCLVQLRSNKLPSSCVMNNFDVGLMPEEIKELNDYEKILIQRAKTFQVVQRLGTISGKKIPNTMRIQQLKGQSFHLPLPLEQTIDKICSTTDPINKNHELYILVRGIPNKSNIVWENIVDLEKVLNCLIWLKKNNPIYKNILIPDSAKNLVQWLNSDRITFNCDLNENIVNTEIKKVAIDHNYCMKSQEKTLIDHNYSQVSSQSIKSNFTRDSSFTQVDNSYFIRKNKNNVLPINESAKSENQLSIENKGIVNNDTEKSQQIIDDNMSDFFAGSQKSCNGSQNLETLSPNLKKITTTDHNYCELSAQLDDNKAALLTQVLDTNHQYDQFTIYPLHDKRINENSTNLYQMLKVHEKPLDNRMEILDLLCFPYLYPFGENGQHEERITTIQHSYYIKTRLTSADPRFRLNIQYLFYLFNDANIRQLKEGIFYMMNIKNYQEKMTVSDYLNKLVTGDLEADLSTIFSRLRNSEQYWSKPRNDIRCMIRNYGPATWFLTVSPAEWLWQDLSEYLKAINTPLFDKLSVSEMIVADPVSVSRFVDNKFKAFLDFIQSDSHPIGKVIHYFWRREYQGRGVQHFHMLIWIEDAPIIGKNTQIEIEEFILKYITCHVPDRRISPTLHRRVNMHQNHYHNSYCLRSDKDKKKVCRFGFPRPITNHFVLRDPIISVVRRRKLKNRNRLYDLPRKQCESNINDYNPAILLVWEGNMDIQYVAEESTLLTHYCTKYAMKSEKAKHTDVIDDINSNMSLIKRLWKIAFRSLNHREVGSLEAADTLLGHSLYGTDAQTVIKWIDVRMVRKRKLQSYEKIKQLNEVDPNSNDVYCPSLIDDYYPNRPKIFESMCLYDFVKWYIIEKKQPQKMHGIESFVFKGKTLYLKKHSFGYLINHYRYNIHTQPENYYYALLLLFQPWRDTNELKNGCKTYTESFKSQENNLIDAYKYHQYSEEFQKGLDNTKKLIEQQMVDSSNKNVNDVNNVNDKSELNIIMKELEDVNDIAQQNLDLFQMMQQMNEDQQRIFEKISNKLKSNDSNPLRLYISGEGGTGKSFLIKLIRVWITQELKSRIIVAAPTGMAAFNIDGLTLHRIFQLPVEHGYTPSYRQLSDDMLKILRETFKDVVVIIIDEISMVSNVMLMYIHLRLVEIFNTSDNDPHDGWFGGKHIIVFGDLFQLPPINLSPAYVNLTSSEVEKYINGLSCINVWTHYFEYDELQINMRQREDNSYAELLSRLRIETMTSDDIKLLRTRIIKIDFESVPLNERTSKLCDYINSLPNDIVCLFPTCKQCDYVNSVMIEKIPSKEIVLIAQDDFDCPKILHKKATKLLDKLEEKSNDTAGLAKIIKIKIGAKIMLRRNIDVTLGLVNGTIGIVKSVFYGGNEIDVQSISVSFAEDKEYVIERMNVKFQIMDRAFIVRKQFPICLSYAITIHKSQGLSLNNIVVDAGNTIFSPGQSYVALSRVKTLDGLHLINLDPYTANVNTLAIEEYNRLRKIYRPDLSVIETPDKRYQKVSDRIWFINAFNIQDENNHMEKISRLQEKLEIRTIQSSDDMSSYMNATLQCIFHIYPNNITKGIIYDLIKIYRNNAIIISSQIIREMINEPTYFTENKHEPYDFFKFLCEKDGNLRNLVEYRINYIWKCKECEYINNRIENKCILSLEVSNSKKVCNLEEIISKSLSHWKLIDKYQCISCNNTVKAIFKQEIQCAPKHLILKLSSVNIKNKQSVKIKSVPTSRVCLCNTTYKVVNAIFFNINTNSYTSILSDKKSSWVHIDDLKIVKTRWPTLAKNVHILFLQCIKNK